MSKSLAIQRRPRAGFTLLESLMAAGILLIIVVAVTSAVTAGQQHAYEAQQRIAGTLAAEELLGRLLLLDYDELGGQDGRDEPPGQMRDTTGTLLPPSFDAIGRRVYISARIYVNATPDAQITGRTVRVVAYDPSHRTLADLQRFVPSPSPALNNQKELLGALGGTDDGIAGAGGEAAR